MSAVKVCGKCAYVAESDEALDAHFDEADHPADPDFPVFMARRNVDMLRDELDATAVRLASAELVLARIEISQGGAL